MKTNYDGLLFDMDGVLVDVTNSYRVAIKNTASYFLDRKVTILEVNKVKEIVGMNNDWDATYALINNKEIAYKKVKNIFQKFYLGDEKVSGLIDNETLLVPKNTLERLKRKYKTLGIATGRPRIEAEYVLDRFKINELFDVLIAKEDTKREKPFPDPLIKALRIMKVKKPVYIGDSPSDVLAAQAAKMPCLYVGDQELGTYRFDSMSQVIDALL